MVSPQSPISQGYFCRYRSIKAWQDILFHLVFTKSCPINNLSHLSLFRSDSETEEQGFISVAVIYKGRVDRSASKALDRTNQEALNCFGFDHHG